MNISATMKTLGTFSILAMLLLAGCVQVSSNVSSLPTTQPATSGSISISAVNSATSNEPAEEMTISQLLADYAADPVKAAAQHEGKRYLFRKCACRRSQFAIQTGQHRYVYNEPGH